MGWSAQFFQTVDWEAHEMVIHSYSRFKGISISKCIHGLWHSGAQKVLYGKKEDGTHIFQCKDQAVITNMTQLFLELEKKFGRRKIPLPVAESLLQGLRWFLEDSGSTIPTPLPNTLGNICPQKNYCPQRIRCSNNARLGECL